MVNSTEHALAIQSRRYAAGKFGVAKAVRSFFKRGCSHAQDVDACFKLARAKVNPISRWPAKKEKSA